MEKNPERLFFLPADAQFRSDYHHVIKRRLIGMAELHLPNTANYCHKT